MAVKKTAKKKPVRKKQAKSMITSTEPALLRLENNIPITGKSSSPEIMELKESVRSLVRNMNAGQSFVVRKRHRTTVRKLLTAEFQKGVFKSSLVTTAPDFARFWRVK